MKTRYAMSLGLFVASAAAAQNYTIQSSSQAYTQLTGGTSLIGAGSNMFGVGDDDESVVIPIGFTFPYYGQTFTQILIDTNGLLSFSTGHSACPSGACYSPNAIPSTTHDIDVPHNLLAPWWADSAIDGTTNILYASSSSQFTVEFRNLVGSDQSDNIYSLNFSVTLFPSGVIQFAYGSSGNAEPGGDGSTVGFENGDGTMGASLPLPPTNMPCSSTDANCDPSVNWPANTLYTVGQQVQPDLVVDHIVLNSVTHSGANLTVSISPTFRNFGQNAATGFLWNSFLSLDRTLDASDIPLYTSTVPLNCAGGATVTDPTPGVATIPVPAPGQYYVLVQADSTNVVNEGAFGETNNVGSTDNYFVSGLDLVATSVSGPATSGPGNVINVELKYFNQGTDNAGTVSYEVRLSTDTTYQTSDFLLYTGSRSVSGGQTVDDTIPVTIPDNAPGGDSYFILHIVPVAGETSTTNNDVASAQQVNIRQADLVATSADLLDPATGLSTRRALFGETGRVQVVATNSGGADAKNFKWAVVLSTDANLSLLSDQILVETPVTLIAAGTSQLLDVTFPIPLSDKNGVPYPTGNYYVFALLDSQDQVTELNEANNNLAVDSAVLISAPAPDLTVVRVDAPASAGVGEIAPIYRVLKNVGNVDAPPAKYAYYISANATITQDDIPLKIVTGATPVDFGTVTLAQNQSDTGTDLVQLPSTLTPGTWYIGALIDPDNAVLELDETNNGLGSAPVQVAASSLSVATKSLPDAVAGRTFSFGCAVNGGVPGMASTWSIDTTTGTLPAGLTISSAGLISGTPTTVGVSSFTLVVSNAGRQAIGRVALRVLPTTTEVEITTGGLPSIVNNPTVKYNLVLGAAGGAQPYSWAVVGGGLPAGITLDPSGFIAGFPRAGTAQGQTSVTLQVRDSLGTTAQAVFAVRVIAAGSIIFKDLAIPDGLVGIAYTQDVPAVNADGSAIAKPLTFQLVAGALPPGMSEHTEQMQVEILDGTPTVAGTYPFTLQVTDGLGRTDEGDFVMRVYASRLTVSGVNLPTLMRPGDPAAFSFTAVGSAMATLKLYSGALPPGLTLASSGQVSGSVAADKSEGTYNFVIEADDATGSSGLGAFALNVESSAKSGGCSAAPTGLGLWLLAAFVPLLTLRRRLKRVGGVAAAAALALVVLPGVARAQPSYDLSGPTAVPYVALAGGTAVAGGATIGIPFSWKFYGSPVSAVTMSSSGYLAISGAGDDSFNVGIPSSDPDAPTAFIAPWWEDLTAAGTGGMRYQVLGASPNRSMAFEWFNVYPSFGSPAGKMSFEAILYEGTNQIRFAYGGQAPSGGDASVGIQLQSDTGIAALSCTSSVEGDCDTANYPGVPTQSVIDFFLPADLTITSLSLDQFGYSGVPFHATALVSNIGGRTASNFTVRFYLSTNSTYDSSDPIIGDSTAQNLAANAQLNMTSTHPIPANTTPGSYFILSQVDPGNAVIESDETNNFGPPQSIQIGLPTADLIVAAVTGPAAATPGQVVNLGRQITNVGNADAPTFKYTWFLSDNPSVAISDPVLGTPFTVDGGLAAGIANVATDQLTLPANLHPGYYWYGVCANFDPTATPEFGVPEISQVNDCNQSTTPMVITSGALTVLTTTLPATTQYSTYGLRLEAGGGNGGYAWALASGSALPPGMTLDAQGEFQGSPAQAGAFTFSVTVTSGGSMQSQSLSLSVAAGTLPLTIVDQLPPAAAFGESYQVSLIGVGGKPAYVWALSSDSQLPLGLGVSSDGLIEGRALALGTFSFTVTLTDSANTMVQKDLTLNVIAPSTMHISTTSLKTAYVDQDYTQILETVGGKAPYTWALQELQQLPENATEMPGVEVDGAFPDAFGLHIVLGSTVYLEGQPKLAGQYALTIKVTDANGSQDFTTLLLEVSYTEPLAITTTSLPDAFIGHDYLAKLSNNRAAQSTGFVYTIPCVQQATATGTFACVPLDATHNLPAGLTLTASGMAAGTLSGNAMDPTGLGDATYSFLVKVVDDEGRQDVRSLSIHLRPDFSTASGCGCGSSELAPFALLALALIRRKRARS